MPTTSKRGRLFWLAQASELLEHNALAEDYRLDAQYLTSLKYCIIFERPQLRSSQHSIPSVHLDLACQCRRGLLQLRLLLQQFLLPE
jgi:hypothetical protein